MRILGIDYGIKRIGVALSDTEAKFGQPYVVVKNTKTALARIASIADQENVSEIILGESKDFKGQENVVMVKMHVFKNELETLTGKTVIFEPEFLTSHQAQYFQGKHDLLDASAAALILQSYLDRKNNQGNK